MYNVYQHWDKLKVCIVGKSYSPEFYSYITNTRVRNVMERIAIETEEDYQKLINLLENFNVKVLRPEVYELNENIIKQKKVICKPPMQPRDICAMIGNKFYFKKIKENLISYKEILKIIKHQGNIINYDLDIDGAMTTNVGKDLIFGTADSPIIQEKSIDVYIEKAKKEFGNDFRCNFVDSQGHLDGCFCPVKPGLIISLYDIQNYKTSFPDWEVVYLPDQSWSKVSPFLEVKKKNKGKWWVPGEELNDDFTDFVENWFNHWVGYVEETVFDVNMLIIDEKNIICNNYNKKVFDAFERHGVTPHVVNFRHRYFWDGGLHCITSDLDREGTMQDYFPERG